jgi:hypothetical protein
MERERNVQGEVMNKSSLENTQQLSRWEEEHKGKQENRCRNEGS